MLEIKKDNLIIETCNVMGMCKIKDNDFEKYTLKTSIGDYHKVDFKDIKRSMRKDIEIPTDESPLLIDSMDITISTPCSSFSGYFVEKAMKILDELGQDYDFDVYEGDKEEMPVILINKENTAFIIAPRFEDIPLEEKNKGIIE